MHCRVLYFFVGYFYFLMPVYAHLGHMGEIAGHTHWVGVGAVFAAGLLAGLIGKIKDKSNADADDLSVEDEVEAEEVAA